MRAAPALIVCVVMLGGCTSAAGDGPNGSSDTSADPNSSTFGEPGTAGGRILFTRSDELFSANPDGTIESHVHTGCCARWSPDGTQILVPVLTDDGRITTGIVAADGTDLATLPLDVPGLNLGAGAWSPDAERFALQGWNDGDSSQNGLYTSAIDGSDVVRLTTNRLGDRGHPGADIPAAYSPDGTRILFQRSDPSGRGDRGRAAVWIIRTDGSGLRRLTPWLPGSWSGDADWSPDGTQIVYDIVDFDEADFEHHYRGEIRLIDADGTNDHMVRIDVPDGVSAIPPYFAKQPTWSPDGSRIAFSMWPEWDTDGNQLFSMAPNGSDLRQMTTDLDIEHEWVDWATDGAP